VVWKRGGRRRWRDGKRVLRLSIGAKKRERPERRVRFFFLLLLSDLSFQKRKKTVPLFRWGDPVEEDAV
jgi:hypothetical protein